MKTYIFLAAFMVACVHLAESMADRDAPVEPGYTQADVRGMDRLVARVIHENPNHGVLYKPMTDQQKVETIEDLFNLKGEKL